MLLMFYLSSADPSIVFIHVKLNYISSYENELKAELISVSNTSMYATLVNI